MFVCMRVERTSDKVEYLLSGPIRSQRLVGPATGTVENNTICSMAERLATGFLAQVARSLCEEVIWSKNKIC